MEHTDPGTSVLCLVSMLFKKIFKEKHQNTSYCIAISLRYIDADYKRLVFTIHSDGFRKTNIDVNAS